MDPRPLNYIAEHCGGELSEGSGSVHISRVCTDSRQVQSGDLFIALRGERFDGHSFIGEVARTAAAVMVERVCEVKGDLGCPVIRVEDTRRAFGSLASAYRRDFTLPVIAVAGSNGKTSTKELIASVLSQRLRTLWSEASFNNDIGVPATLLRLNSTHQAAVVEVGTNHPGELAPLLRLVQPAYGVITSVGHEHLEFFGDLEGVAREEGALAELLPANGVLLVNGDQPWAQVFIGRSRASSIRLGFKPDNDWRIRSARLDRHGVTFAVEAPELEWAGEYRTSLLGRHMALNSLFAICLGRSLGLDRESVQKGLAECKPARMRMQLWEVNGVRVVDDAYNANADSMVAALQTLKELPCRGRRVAVLGDMAELGSYSLAAHEEVGRRAAELGVGQLFAVGRMASAIARGAREAGLNRVLEFEEIETAGAAVKQFVKEGDLLLLKASRATRFERIAALLRGESTAPPNGRKSL